MSELMNKDVLVVGLGGRGRAACELLRRSGARVVAVDPEDTESLREEAHRLEPLGVEVQLGVSAPPKRDFNLAVLSPTIPIDADLVRTLAGQNVPIIGELELGYRQSRCLNIAVAGTNGKGTTAEMIEQMLLNNHRKTIRAGHGATPVCSVVEQTKELDFLILQVNSFQLELTQFFRPAVAVLLNLHSDHLDRYASMTQYIRANSRLFQNQQAFDWAIVQSDALRQLREQRVELPSKVITFSATDSTADLHLNRGLIISRMPNWTGPLLDTDECLLRGPHDAENLMAALAVGRALRLSLEEMAATLKAYSAGPHRFELVAEIGGVQFINDSKATNIAALEKSLLAARAGKEGQPNVWLVAGGRDKGLDFHQIGPLLARRVKGAFLIGEAAEKIRAAWSLFTPCTLAGSLLEAISSAVKCTTEGDVVLLSPACSSLDAFRNYQERGQRFCEAVKSISRGLAQADPNINGSSASHHS
jgi:UDP-N-acetylmuramoylalanine--D-glutamate ligase